MAIDVFFLVGGLVALVWSADQFVAGASRLAVLFELPPVVVGAVIIGFGTSAPEMIVSAIAAVGGDRDLGVGNVVGSNVANLTLVLGVAALIARMTIPRGVLSREAPLAIGASAIFALFVSDGDIDRWEGGVLIGLLIVVIVFLLRSGRGEALVDPDEVADTAETSRLRESVRTVIGLGGTVLGAQLVVSGATDLADRFGVSGGFVGFSLVAVGTSLPELVTTVAAARRGETELIVGNLFGSNIFNALAVGGVMGLLGPGLIGDPALTGVGVSLMLVTSVIAYVLARWGRSVGRRDGIVLIACYLVTTVALATMTDAESGADGPGDRQGLSAPQER